jgi:hypothetical protein
MDKFQAQLIGALVQKLGGNVELTPEDMATAPVVTLQRTPANPNIKLWVDAAAQPPKL